MMMKYTCFFIFQTVAKRREGQVLSRFLWLGKERALRSAVVGV
jgi:hypothetical protein